MRRIAVVPAYNEEPTVEAVLDRLYPLVDELVVVDDGSTDNTRKIIEEWLRSVAAHAAPVGGTPPVSPGFPAATLLTFDRNRGMSAAYYEAFSHLAARLRAGEISPDDHVFTVDADGQHELAVFDELGARMERDGLDALLVRRDLSTYPLYKRSGNWLISAWASLWAGYRLYDVESGYRIFRAGALVDALSYYRGYKYSETVEIAVVLGRRHARVRNDVLVPVPVFRSRTRLFDFVVDAGLIPVAAARVWLRRAGRGGRLAPFDDAAGAPRCGPAGADQQRSR
jgi:glycosyltransferase involved in cell wall biosynthesis